MLIKADEATRKKDHTLTKSILLTLLFGLVDSLQVSVILNKEQSVILIKDLICFFDSDKCAGLLEFRG